MKKKDIPEDILEYYETLADESEKDLEGFDILELLEDNGRKTIERFFEKMYRVRKKRTSFLEKRVDKYIEEGKGDKSARRSQGLRFLYEDILFADRYLETIAIHCIKIFGDEEIAKGLYFHYVELQKRILDEYIEEDRNYIVSKAGQYVINDRIMDLLQIQRNLKDLDLDKDFERIRNYKPSKKKSASIGTGMVYISIACAIAAFGEAYSYGSAFLIRFGPLSDVISIIEEIQEIALKINEKIPLISSDEPNPDFDFDLMRAYLLPETELLDSIRQAISKYQNKIDRAYSRG